MFVVAFLVRCIIFVRDVASVELLTKIISSFAKPMFQIPFEMSDREKFETVRLIMPINNSSCLDTMFSTLYQPGPLIGF